MGKVLSIFHEKNCAQYFLIVETFSPLEQIDTSRNPYLGLKYLNAQMVYQEDGSISVIHQDNILGFVASMAYEAKKAQTSKDVYCAVAIDSLVS